MPYNKKPKDEFYTLREDIDEELAYYKEHFRGKHVFCSCDEIGKSKFWSYFIDNFHDLGLEKVTAINYIHQSLWDRRTASKVEFNGTKYTQTRLRSSGDFRSKESRKVLQECDIVVTNPPFSHWAAFLRQTMDYGKKFLIVGMLPHVTQFIEPYKEHKFWLGVRKRDLWFLVPPHYEVYAAVTKREDGNNYIEVGFTRWFTNMDHGQVNEFLPTDKKYTPEEYPQYTNYPAIEVKRLNSIPGDYPGEMGVPLSFLEHYNPKQFKIIRALPGGSFKGQKSQTFHRVIIRHAA